MSLKVQLKHSAVKDKAPVAADLTNGELALNINDQSPAAYIKDSAGNIVKLAGAGAAGDVWDRTGTALSPHTAGDSVQISAGTAALPGLTPVGDPNTGIYSPGADQVAISTNGSQRILIEDDGDINIGSGGVFYDATNKRLAIGATSPAETLAVTDTIQDLLRLKTSAVNAKLYFQSSTTTGSNYIQCAGDDLSVVTNSSERVRVDAAGRLLVGTSSWAGGNASFVIRGGPGTQYLSYALPATGTARDTVLGNLYFSGRDGEQGASIGAVSDDAWAASDYPTRLAFATTADGASTPTERMRISSTGITRFTRDTSTANNLLIEGKTDVGGANSTVFIIRAGGDVENVNNAYGAISDAKLKENIVDAKSQWDDLKALQVRNYNFKEGQTHTQIGLIAQEVERVSPGLVSESPDLDEDGNDLGTVTKSVNYSVLYMKAVKALQEAIGRIETLEAEVAALKAS